MFKSKQIPSATPTSAALAQWTRNLFMGVMLSAAACSAGGSSSLTAGSKTGASGTLSGSAATAAIDTPVTITNDNTTAASAESLATTGRLVIKANINKCLGVAPDGVSIGVFDCAGLGTQGWTVQGQAIVHSSKKCLAVGALGTVNGATLTLATCDAGQAAQIWTVSATSITQGTGQLCLDVKDHLQAEGTPVQLWACTGQSNQTWRVAPTVATNPAVMAVVTSPDLSLALSNVTVDAGTVADADASDVTVILDPGVTYQTMTGFGAALTDSSSSIMHTGLTQASLDALMSRLFDPAQGIGISILRQSLGSSDFSSVGNFSYDDGNPDFTLANFNITQDMKHTIPLLKTAVALNPNIFILGTPWSPPAWMKNNSSMYGSPTSGGVNTLKSNSVSVYAQYFVKFIQAYAAQGITVSAVTPQNEPLNDGTLPSMYFVAADEGNFIAQNLGPALKASKLNVAIWGYDHNWDRLDYPQALLANSAAKPYVAAAAFHCYGGAATAMTTFHNTNPNVPIQMTECSDGSWHTNSFADMTNLIIDSSNNWSQSVLFWAMALNPDGGPTNNGCTDCTALVTVDPNTHTVAYNIDFYIMGQASKYVLPGAKRISSTVTGSNVSVVAFENPDLSQVALVYNTSSAVQAVKVKGTANVLNVKVPANSFATVRLTSVAAAAG